MDYTTADVFVYQILDVLVTKYDYKIVNVPRNKKDIWLANDTNETYPMIRLSAVASSSAVFEQDYLSKIKSALSMVLNKKSPLLIINTNEESNSFNEGDIVQITLVNDKFNDVKLLHVFPELSDAIKRVEDNQSECAKLTRHLENNQMHKLKESRKFKWSTAPKLSIIIIAICMVAFLAVNLLVAGKGTSWIANLVVSGGYYKALVVYGGEYWRLITTSFIHLDFMSLLFYAAMLYQLGRICEKVYSKTNFLIIFIGSMLIGNVFPLILEGNIVSLGMGAGIFGLMASLIVYIWDGKLYTNKVIRLQMNQIMMFGLLATFLQGISVFALMGGFVGGLFLSFILYQSQRFQEYKIHFIVCGVILLGVLGFYGYQVDSAYPQIKDLDKQVVEKYNKMGLKDYANTIEGKLKAAYIEEK